MNYDNMAGPSSTTASSEATPLIPSLSDLPHIVTKLPHPAAVISTLVSNSVSKAYRFRNFVHIILLFVIISLCLFSYLFFDHSLFPIVAVLLIILFHALFLIFVILFCLRPTWIPKLFLLSNFAQGAMVAPVLFSLVGFIGLTFVTGAVVITDFAIVAAFKTRFQRLHQHSRMLCRILLEFLSRWKQLCR